MNHLAVRSSIEGDLLLAGQRAVEIDRQVVETAERRHGAQLAIGEESPEFVFGSHAGVGQPQGAADFVKIDELVGGDDEHEESLIAGDDNSLSNLPCGQMLRRSDLAGREGIGMVGQREFGLMGIKEIT